MRKTILALFGALLLGGPLLAADKPLVIESGQTKQLPAATSLQLSAPTTANATINMPHGTAPTSPTNGDCWTTTAGLSCRINGATVTYGAGGGSVSLTGDVTGSGTSSIAATLATVNSNVGTFGSATQSLTATVNAKGLITALSAQTITPAFSSITGTATVTQGGNGLSTATLGDLRYGSGVNTLAILAGNTSATKKFLTQTGTGTVSAAPAWGTIAASDIGSGAALTKTDDTNVTLTLGGSPSTALLSATSITAGWTGTLAVTRGGTGTTTSTGTGSNVLSNSPTFTGSPVLPTPSAVALTLTGSVTNVGGAYATAAYRKYADGRVSVEGWLQGGGGTSPVLLATLPVGARPIANQTFACVAFASGVPSACMFEVQSTGGVYWYSTNTSAAFSISGINFQG